MSLAATRVTVGAPDGLPYHVVIGARVADTVPAMLGERSSAITSGRARRRSSSRVKVMAVGARA